MKQVNIPFNHFLVSSRLIRWALLVIPVSLSVGTVVAFFLWLLDKVTLFRQAHSWLLFLLPLAGIFIYGLYTYLGKNADGGNNLIMNEIHEPGGGVPFRMAPLVLFTTLLTHLFGGSAGREGTAVQIGGSLAGWFARRLGLSAETVKVLLMAGIAAGFGAVFGTPVTGALFALEVLSIGTIRHGALLPCFIASLLADVTCSAWGIHHTRYQLLFHETGKVYFSFIHLNFLLLFQVLFAGVLFGLAGYAFAEISHAVKAYSDRLIRVKWLIPVAGGLVIIAGTYLLGTADYLGLGVTNPHAGGVSIVSCFSPGGASLLSWWWKLLFTAITLGTGFKGGEVTPLFFVGAALGNTFAMLTGAPVDLLAGLGFIAVFAGATNTPIACTLMGVELFGGEHLLYYAVACFTAYYFSGHSGIYTAQRLAVSKMDGLDAGAAQTLSSLRQQPKGRKQWFTHRKPTR